ncbi:hypothetical protein DFH06DRAFT_717187 [Mycena polygramma]|nr:hypothetical protein DFH06DRAFT_717187 [Mycena polygramma]
MAHPCWNCGASTKPSADCLPALESAHDFVRLRTSNDAPLDSEIPLIREIISNGEDRLDTLETQIRDSEAALANLVQSRDATVEYLREQRVVLHPLRRAPPELICEIFAMTLDTDDSTHVRGSEYDPLWYLSHICRSWRLWALAYPRLWSHITIPSSPPHPIDRAVLETLLLRSSNAPLNVCCTVEDEDEHFVDCTLADLAVLHCRRWVTLRIDLSRCGDADTLKLSWLHPVKGCLPSLRSLDVLCFGDTVDIPDVFSVAPSLRQVLLTDWKLTCYSPNMQFPWDQITHYRGAFREATQLDILRAAPKLVQCAVSFDTSVHLTPGTSSAIALSHLRRLCIQLPSFLHHLTAPSLEELYCVYMRHVDIPALLPFVCRSDCLLQKLVLMSCFISSELITTLRSLPSLTYLLISPLASPEEHTDLLCKMRAGTFRNLCPNLSSLVYGCTVSYPSTFPKEPFFTMIQSRIHPNPSGSRLTYLRIFDPSIRSDIISATRDIRDGGLDADVLTTREFDFLAGKAFFA